MWASASASTRGGTRGSSLQLPQKQQQGQRPPSTDSPVPAQLAPAAHVSYGKGPAPVQQAQARACGAAAGRGLPQALWPRAKP